MSSFIKSNYVKIIWKHIFLSNERKHIFQAETSGIIAKLNDAQNFK